MKRLLSIFPVLIPALVLAVFLAAGSALAPVSASAAGGGDSDGGSSTWGNSVKTLDPDFAAGMKAAEAKNFGRAVPLLEKAVATDPENADAFNLLGYSRRNAGDFDGAFTAYEKALTLNPKHKGAHEYIGEAYLQTGNLTKAEEHLKALDKLCFFGCDEYSELKDRIAAFKEGKPVGK